METLALKAEPRAVIGKKVKQLRRSGFIPAVLYGRDQKATLIQITHKTLSKVLAQAGTHQLISLEIDGQKPHMALARDIQRDVIRRDYLHVDFYAVKMDEKVTAQVPIVPEGKAPATEIGGIFTQGLDTLEIECLPADLISAIPVDVSGLEEFNDSIIVANLKVPSSITVLSDPDSMVIKIVPPRKVADIEAELEAGVEGAEVVVGTEDEDVEDVED